MRGNRSLLSGSQLPSPPRYPRRLGDLPGPTPGRLEPSLGGGLAGLGLALDGGDARGASLDSDHWPAISGAAKPTLYSSIAFNSVPNPEHVSPLERDAIQCHGELVAGSVPDLVAMVTLYY